MGTPIRSLEDAKILTQKLHWEKDQIEDLEKQFHQLAEYFLYGGYVRVLDRYRIYIQRVEFYFHSEKDDKNAIKDYIVYHRNYHHINGTLPYFTPFTFHAHASGFDIAFENPKAEYRASELIRAYEVYDEYVKQYLKVLNGKFVYSEEPFTNTQSTYLYDILNGFGNVGVISWKHDISELYNKSERSTLIPIQRKGVDAFDEKGNRLRGTSDQRKWSFKRQEFIPIN